MSNIKTQFIHKLLSFILVFGSIYAFTNSNPQLYLNDGYMITNDTIPEVTVSITKAERYKIYLRYCNELVKDTFLQTGFLNFDTMRVSSIPTTKLYFGKTIIKGVQISKEMANIILMDTIWNSIDVPEYQSSWDYYILANHPRPIRKTEEFDYSNKIMVFRPRAFTIKRSKPLEFSDWQKYINNKSNRASSKEQYF